MRFGLTPALPVTMASAAVPGANAETRLAPATAIAGNYGVIGTNPDGSKYSGTFVVS